MAYDEILAGRVRRLMEKMKGFEEKIMFGGVGFLLDGNMACGINGDDLIVRVGAEANQRALSSPYTRPFDMTGRPMKGWVLVAPQGCRSDDDLRDWVQSGVDFARSLPPK
jgi:TfoX/Sxy family transcriptional regulator of competence genes